MADIAELGLDTSQFTKALQDVEAELKDLTIEATKLNAEIKLLERNMFLAGGGTKAQSEELKKLNMVAEDFAVQIKKAKEEQKAFKDVTAEAGKESSGLSLQLRNITAILGGYLGFQGFQSFFTKLEEASKNLREFREEIDRISNTGLGGGLTQSFADLSAKVKDADAAIKELSRDKGIIESFFELFAAQDDLTLNKGGGIFETARALAARKEEQLTAARTARAEAQEKIVEKVKEETNILDLQRRGMTELVELKKIELKFDADINAARKSGNQDLENELKLQKQNTLEMAAQAQLAKDRSMEIGTRNWDAEGEIQDKKVQEEEQDRKNSENKLRRSFDQRGEEERVETDRKAKQDHDALLRQDDAEFEASKADQSIALFEDKAKKRARNKENRELQGELTVTDLARRGNKTAANKEKVAQDFDRKIRDAIKSGNVEGEELLRKQANSAQAGFDVEDSKKTAGQRSSERAAGRAVERNEANAKQQNADLDDRLARGARGDKNSRLEQRREENARNAARAGQQDQERKDKEEGENSGYGKEDRNFLREIRDALKPKD